ncbi:RCCLKC-tail radical SAM protein [Vogesella fluminis]|uniref:Radical SAM protein n=1 Tax=Vogesella fluminis TaxID=1069161 RepID=A0ABQ3HEU1_9NEIS|nr:RCCLKC-tail radical SAM protein [Vogesella fluminis]GHD81869.1 radical SAM protein [Vogesella fluminis]
MAACIVLTTFEGGYQPVTALTGASALKRAGVDVQLVDVYVSGVEVALDAVRSASYVAISIPLFDSLTTGIQLAQRVREANEDAKIIFFGQYASINVERLTGKYCDFTVSGEWEQPLVSIVTNRPQQTAVTAVFDIARLHDQGSEPIRPVITRDHLLPIDRAMGPPLSKYPQPQLERLLGRSLVVGGLETTRGCHHKCTYCSVYAAYDGKVVVVPEDLVIQDVDVLIQQGMTHLTFTDADFFNTKRHGTALMKAIHERHPALTFDFTARVDHILENKQAILDMATYGLSMITSALEFPSQTVLDQVYKEMTVDMIQEAVEFLREVGVQLNPTFIMFNPWSTLEDLAKFHDFIQTAGLTDNVDPVQYETRLHLYKGSPLLENESIQALELEEGEFHVNWKHPDARVDELYASMVKPPVEGEFKRCCLKC